MKRIYEELKHSVVLAPQDVATATEKATDFVDASGMTEVEFLIATGALAVGKTLTVKVSTSDVADGTGAILANTTVFTADDANPTVTAVSYKVTAAGGRYVGVSIQHDAAAAVACGVTASCRVRALPAENGWVLVV